MNIRRRLNQNSDLKLQPAKNLFMHNGLVSEYFATLNYSPKYLNPIPNRVYTYLEHPYSIKVYQYLTHESLSVVLRHKLRIT